uniref:Uncharacterized protein n=1 Tax=Anopheles atroparvus TaxID=41427 RepID=A0A182IPP3_ANOAO
MLTKRFFTSGAFPAFLQLGALLLLQLLIFEPKAHGQQLTSPCPSIFNFRWDPLTNQVFGFIQLYNLRIGQVVRLNVALSIGANVPRNNVGSITLIKSKEQTFRDIQNKRPAQYRVNLPFRNLFPNLLAVYVNGQPVCYGQRASGRIVTTINLDHTLVTQLCGKPSPVYNKLSINGKLSPKGQFPWAVPIFDARPIKPKYICGSTILNKYHLVTAAHCMYDDSRKFRPSELVTMPGMYNIDNFFESDIQERDVASIIVHPDYDDYDNTGNDIALMVLQQAIIYTDLIRPICLWNGNDNVEEIVGRTGYVSGWGITEKGSAKKPS